MAYSFLIFDFGGNEETAQQARHRVDGWKQGFRLGKKLELKFERRELITQSDGASSLPSKAAKESPKGKAKPKAKSKSAKEKEEPASSSTPSSEIHLILRLDFSDHEKLSLQRWLDRIPTEDLFKTANPKVIRPGDAEFDKTSEKFDALD